MEPKKQILILINEKLSENDKNWEFFRGTIARSIGDDVDITMGTLLGLTFELHADESRIYDREASWNIDKFDLVVFRYFRREFARASSVATHLIAKGTPYIDSRVKPYRWSKYSAQAMRQSAGMANIPSLFSTHAIMRSMIEHEQVFIPYPLIIKDNNGRKGRLKFIAHDKQQALDIFDQNQEVDFIIQTFIENDGDYRVLVIGGELKLAIQRRASEGSHLNNTSQGGVAEIVPLDSFNEASLEDVRRAAEIDNLQIAGVDLMFDRHTGQHYILEVNSSPQLATGAFPEMKVEACTTYLRSLLNADKD